MEGPTDEDALAAKFTKLVAEYGIEFDVLHTDITADEEWLLKYIEKKIKEEIGKYLRKNPFLKAKDILKIIQIIDTDGAFIAPPLDETVGKWKDGVFQTLYFS